MESNQYPTFATTYQNKVQASTPTPDPMEPPPDDQMIPQSSPWDFLTSQENG